MMSDEYVLEFTDGYIECALWSESAYLDVADDGTVTEDPESDTSFESHNFDSSDLDDAARETIEADCLAFIEANEADLRAVESLHTDSGWSSAAQSGHDFWLTRNGHGAGFWDRGYGPVGDRLSTACKPYGETRLYAILGRDADNPVNVTDVSIGIE